MLRMTALLLLTAAALAEVKLALLRAINLGAPTFNSGNIEGCRYIYYRTAEEIVLRLDEPSAEDNAVREALVQAIQSTEDQDGSTAAFSLRQTFDSILQGDVDPDLDASSHGPMPTAWSIRSEPWFPEGWLGMDGNAEFGIISVSMTILGSVAFFIWWRRRRRRRQEEQLRLWAAQQAAQQANVEQDGARARTRALAT